MHNSSITLLTTYRILKTYWWAISKFTKHLAGVIIICQYVAPLQAQYIRVKGEGIITYQDSVPGITGRNTNFSDDIDYSGKLVKGDVDFSYSHFQKKASFDGAWFLQPTNFWDATFVQSPNFRDSWFEQGATFGEVNFEEGATFNQARFMSWMHMSAKFSGLANFSYAHFYSETKFLSSIFREITSFHSAKFDSTAIFDYAQFQSTCSFQATSFDQTPSFEGVHFESISDFSNATFASGVNFKQTIFGSVTTFDHAVIKGNMNFSQCQLPDTLLLTYLETDRIVDLTYSLVDTIQLNRSTWCVIDLYGSPINKLRFDYSRFRILQDESIYSRAQITYLYEQVLQLQRSSGFLEGAEIADKEYQRAKLTYGKSTVPRVFGYLQRGWNWIWSDYGYKRWLIFPWTVFALLCLTAFNYYKFDWMNTNVYKIEKIYRTHGYSPRLLDVFFYTCLVFFGLRLNISEINFQNRWGTFILFFQYTIGIILLAYLANFVIKS